MKTKKMNTKAIVYDAVLIALYTVLSLYDIKIGNSFKFSLASLPVVVGGMLFGPVHGAVIGFIGCFINQMMTYGLMATTILYVVPYCVCGFVAGLVARLRKYEYSPVTVGLSSFLCTTTLTILNTVALFIASKYEGWYSEAVVFGSLGLKFLKNLGLCALYAAVLPPILKAVGGMVGRQQECLKESNEE